MPNQDVPARFCTDHCRVFFAGLVELGFSQNTDADEDSWSGEIEVGWYDATSKEERHTTHLIGMRFGQSFPFQHPAVWPLDSSPPISNSRHQEPGENGSLCLWPESSDGWSPSITPQELLGHIRNWLVHYHQNDWDASDRPPDLHLYFPSDGFHQLMLVGDDWTPPKDHQSGRFGVWQKDATRAFAGAPIAEASLQPEVHSDRVLSHIGLAQSVRNFTGLWFRLAREPNPKLVLSELLEEIDDAQNATPGSSLRRLHALVGTKNTGINPIMIALGYPLPLAADQGIKEEWLFLKVTGPGGGKAATWKSALEKSKIESFETAPASQQALMRRTRHVSRVVGGGKALIFGQGAIGSVVTVQLAKAGVRYMDIVDSDRIRPGNAVRHAAGLSYIGRFKTGATKAEALEHAPDCEVTCHPATWDPMKLTVLIDDADVVLDATANTSFSLLLNEHLPAPE